MSHPLEHQIGHPLDRQVGGNHYKTTGVQHTVFCQRNRIPWNEACALKYLIRWRRKNGVEDLKKAHHYLEFAKREEWLDREEAGLAPPCDMDPRKFAIDTERFLRDNAVPRDEGVIIRLILNHQVGKGECDLDSAMRMIEALISENDMLS